MQRKSAEKECEYSHAGEKGRCKAVSSCSCSNSQVCEEYRRDANQGIRRDIAKRRISFWNSEGTSVSVWLNEAKSPFVPASYL